MYESLNRIARLLRARPTVYTTNDLRSTHNLKIDEFVKLWNTMTAYVCRDFLSARHEEGGRCAENSIRSAGTEIARERMTHMADVIEGAQSLIGLVSSAQSLTTGLQKLAGGTKVEAQVSELHRVIVSTHQNALVAIQQQISLEQAKLNLEKRLAEFERWDMEAQKYELTSVGTGVVAYGMKSESALPVQTHLLCANCFEQRRKSYIQRTNETAWAPALNVHLHVHWCPACTAKYQFGVAMRPGGRPARAQGYDPMEAG